MKKILFAALAALAITSCTQNEEIEAPSQKSEIKFNTAVSKTSRAADITTDGFKAFKSYAYNHANAWTSATTINSFFSNIDYSTTDNTNWIGKKNDVTQTFYWPATDYVSFFAYFDASNSATWGEPDAKGAPTLTYTVQDKVNEQKDLVVAELLDKQRNQTAGGTTATVSLVFKHALTKIGFQIKGEGTSISYTVNSITINAKNKGIYTYSATTTGANTETVLGNWDTTAGTKTSYVITLEADDKIITAAESATSLTNNEKYVAMLIPQDLDENVTIEVNYKAELNGVTLCDKTTNPEVITLKDTTAPWQPGKSIIYTLNLKGGETMSISGNYTSTWDDAAEELNK